MQSLKNHVPVRDVIPHFARFTHARNNTYYQCKEIAGVGYRAAFLHGSLHRLDCFGSKDAFRSVVVSHVIVEKHDESRSACM